MKIKTYVLIVLVAYFFMFAKQSVGQEVQPAFRPQPKAANPFNNLQEKLYFGGNVGAWFGSTTYLNISPIVGLKLNDEFSVGIGAIYNYYSQTYANKKYTTTIYGGSAFARYFIFENVFAHAGWDRISVPDYTSSVLNSRAWVDNLLVGGGYRESFSDNGSFVAMILYNINQTPLSPYQNPIIQIGFNIGL